MKSFIYSFMLFFSSHLYSQQCVSNAGIDKAVCGGKKFGSNYRVYLDGSDSFVLNGSIEYEWSSLDDGISFSSSQSRRANPYFNYPQNLVQDKEFRIKLRVYNDDETCESVDTVLVVCKANMCPIPDVGEDLTLSSGCDLTALLDASGSVDPDDSNINYYWSSLNGLDANLQNSNSSVATFNFPTISSEQVYSFAVVLDDGENFVSDTLSVTYLKNSPPVADAGADFTTCDYQFKLESKKSYDEDWNSLSYSWSLINGDLVIQGESTPEILVTSPLDLEQNTDFHFELAITETIAGEQYCTDRDTVVVTIRKNICPIADAGENIRVPKFDNNPVVLSAVNSLDPDGEDLIYSWTGDNGDVINDVEVIVTDPNPDSSYSKYIYQLKVTDSEGSFSFDSVSVIFGNFSKPSAPKIFAVADHNRVLVSWDASAESSIDSLTGYADFEGYKLYRSIDGGVTWGGDEDKLYDFDGNFIGWIPYTQFDLDYEEDVNHCIYTNEDCGDDKPKRNTSIFGLDPYAPRFSLGVDSGIRYAFIDSSVVDGIEYTYTVCAYDIGLEPFEMDYTLNDSTQTYGSDTLWARTNPGKFMGPAMISYYDIYGNFLRSTPNPNRGYPYLETDKGSSLLDDNFITVVPGYTPSNVTFPDESDIEAIFLSDFNNIGTGERGYFIVDRNEISDEKILKYEIKANQGMDAIDGIATEDPMLYVFEVLDDGSPKYFNSYDPQTLTFFENDSLQSLPGSFIESSNLIVPVFQLIQPLDRWSDMMDGIRFRFDNALPLSPSAAPILEPSKYLLYNADGTEFDSLEFAQWIYADNIEIELSYTSLTSYMRRLNFDYEIEFFSEATGDSSFLAGAMGLPFRITNLYTGKKVGLVCFDYGSNNNISEGSENGVGDLTWTRGEEISLTGDTVSIGGEFLPKYNFNLKINYRISTGDQFNMAWSPDKEYSENDTVFFNQMYWVTSAVSKNIAPVCSYLDPDCEVIDDNPWKLIYPWSDGDKLIIGPSKFFENGDNWVSDMSVLGKVSTVSDTTLDIIKVVPNPYIVRSRFNETSTSRKLRFTNLPQECRISIFTVTGELIRVLDHVNQFDGNEWWDLRTANNQEVAPGLYIYHVESINGKEKVGKFAVIR